VTPAGPAWVVATSNPGKLRELRALLGTSGIALEPQGDLGIEPADETAPTFVENALLKARHAARRARLPALAEDSGLCISALNGAPGVRSARFAGPGCSDQDNVRRVLDLLADVPESERGAYYYCVAVALRSADDPEPAIGVGAWHGRIATTPVGANGFGYDPIFFVPERGCTAAQLAPQDKNTVSHRARALAALRAELDARAGTGLR